MRAGNYNIRLILPFLFGSIPAAFIGGSLEINKEIFEILLFLVLSIAGLLLLLNNKSYEDNEYKIRKLNLVFFLIGLILGLVSGIVGIGGEFFGPFFTKSRKADYCYYCIFIYFN